MKISKSIQRRVLIQMGKVIKFPLKEIETQDETASAIDMVKAIKEAYSEAELEAIRQELEGYDETIH